jgi:hypothetical protein
MWIESRPNLPLEDCRLLSEARVLKARLKTRLVEAALARVPSPYADEPLWPEALYVALAARRYGVIYWLSRSEAQAQIEACHGNARFRQVIIQADLSLSGLAETIVNHAVVRHLTSSEVRLQVTSAALLAPQTIASTGRDDYLVRTTDLVGWHTGALDRASALFDLHDFAHQLCAAHSPQLFGNKYYPALAALPGVDRRLVTSPNRNSAKGSPFADGLVFSEVLNGMFYDTWSETQDSGCGDTLLNPLGAAGRFRRCVH